jgi:hypothetical protein
MSKVITWQATHDGSNVNATVDLCERHGADGAIIPARLPRPVAVSHGYHEGKCEACACEKIYRVTTSNGDFWQVHFIKTETRNQAIALAEADADKSLKEERLNAAQIAAALGREPSEVKPYKAFRVSEVEIELNDGETVRFIGSGGEG